MVAKRLICNKILVWSLFVALLCLSGCASPPAVKTAAQPPVPHEFEKAALEDGLLAFKEGDYGKAAGIFEVLSASTRLPEINRRALFAHAAALLAIAQTPEEYARAASIWEQWSAQARVGLEGEDPRMLAPFVGRTVQAGISNAAVQTPQVQKDVPNPNHRGALQTKEKEVEALRIKLEARDREVRRLRHQLESLEEIHRKYQEKKQEASTP